MNKNESPGYDPRYDRAQTLTGAKARYVQLDEYSIEDLENDVERIITEGELPDRHRIMYRKTSGVSARAYEKKCPGCGSFFAEVPCNACSTTDPLIIGIEETSA